MDDHRHGLGAAPSAPDARDYRLALAAIPPPQTKQRRFVCTGLGPLLNQGDSPMCTAYAWVGAKQWEEKLDGHGVIPFSPKWLYEQEKILDGDTFPGSTGRQGARVLLARGCAITNQPGQEAKGKIAAYWAVPLTVAAMKQALVQYGPIVTGEAWPESFFYPVRGVVPTPSSQIAGGHETLRFGWDDDVAGGSWIVRNSWGRYKGSVNGNFYLPYRYETHLLWEAWKALDIKGD